MTTLKIKEYDQKKILKSFNFNTDLGIYKISYQKKNVSRKSARKNSTILTKKIVTTFLMLQAKALWRNNWFTMQDRKDTRCGWGAQYTTEQETQKDLCLCQRTWDLTCKLPIGPSIGKWKNYNVSKYIKYSQFKLNSQW